MEEFQYPQADRRGCNQRRRHQHGGAVVGFQYPQADRRGCNIAPILSATAAICRFQYPQADRRGCNREIEEGVILIPDVSVSTSGSKGVQLRKFIDIFSFSPSFSIHKRIEGGATLVDRPVFRKGTSCFSIHKRIEGGATQAEEYIKEIEIKVSVSTSGSKGVQPCNTNFWESLLIVSVSTSGSKGVQLLQICGWTQLPDQFQYPQADRRGCN